jgi:hypothetical protein
VEVWVAFRLAHDDAGELVAQFTVRDKWVIDLLEVYRSLCAIDAAPPFYMIDIDRAIRDVRRWRNNHGVKEPYVGSSAVIETQWFHDPDRPAV